MDSVTTTAMKKVKIFFIQTNNKKMLVNYINYRFCLLFVRKITAFIWNMQVF